MVINRQLRSYADSYDHASLFVSCSYYHCSGAVTIILPNNKTTILQISHGYFVFSLVTHDDKWQIYIECKLCVSTWHARVTIGPCPNPPSPTSAILYDRNCFPTVYGVSYSQDKKLKYKDLQAFLRKSTSFVVSTWRFCAEFISAVCQAVNDIVFPQILKFKMAVIGHIQFIFFVFFG